MYAIFTDGGRQYKVEEGQALTIDLRDELKAGDTLQFDQVLCLSGEAGIKIGKPLVAGASISAEVVAGVEMGEKIYIQKMRRRKNFRKRTGHRQMHTRVKIVKIVG